MRLIIDFRLEDTAPAGQEADEKSALRRLFGEIMDRVESLTQRLDALDGSGGAPSDDPKATYEDADPDDEEEEPARCAEPPVRPASQGDWRARALRPVVKGIPSDNDKAMGRVVRVNSTESLDGFRVGDEVSYAQYPDLRGKVVRIDGDGVIWVEQLEYGTESWRPEELRRIDAPQDHAPAPQAGAHEVPGSGAGEATPRGPSQGA